MNNKNTTQLWQYINVRNTFKHFKCKTCDFKIIWKEMPLQDLLYCPHCGRLIESISNGKYYVMENRKYQGKKYYDGLDPD